MKTERLARQVKISLALAAVLSVILTSCSSSVKSEATDSMMMNSAASGEMYYDAPAMAEPEMEMLGDYNSGSVNAENAKSDNDLSERKIIKNATLSFNTETYSDFTSALFASIASHGGYVESSQQYGNDSESDSQYGRSRRSMNVTARIPADRYDSFMSDAGGAFGCGTQTYRSESQDDVTMSYIDIESHLRALSTEYETLLELLSKAESIEDTITIQARISELNYQMDSYKSQLRKYDDLISYCTVNIDVSEVYREVSSRSAVGVGERISAGLGETFDDIKSGLEDFAVWFVVSLPYIVIWAVVIAVAAIIARLAYRGSRKRRDRAKIDRYLKENENKKQD